MYGACRLFRCDGPAQPERDRRPVILALHRIDRASVVEAKHLIAEVQAGGYHLHALVHAITGLHVELRMRVEVVVAERAPQSKDGIVGRAGRCLPSIRRNILVVVADGEASREAIFVVSQIEVVVIWRSSVETWMICPASVETRWKSDVRGCVTVVRVDTKSTQHARKKREALFPLGFETLDVGAGDR
jgi:hypothetical protein